MENQKNKSVSTTQHRQLVAFVQALESDYYKVYVQKKGRGEPGKRLRRNFRLLKEMLDDIRKDSLQQVKNNEDEPIF